MQDYDKCILLLCLFLSSCDESDTYKSVILKLHGTSRDVVRNMVKAANNFIRGSNRRLHRQSLPTWLINRPMDNP